MMTNAGCHEQHPATMKKERKTETTTMTSTHESWDQILQKQTKTK